MNLGVRSGKLNYLYFVVFVLSKNPKFRIKPHVDVENTP